MSDQQRTKDRPIVHLFCNPYIDPVWRWGWDHALREAGKHLVVPQALKAWQRLDRLGLHRTMTAWLGNLLWTRASPYPTHPARRFSNLLLSVPLLAGFRYPASK